MGNIHPTAIIEDGAQIAEDAKIGAYCHISSQTVIGSKTELKPHVVIDGKTEIGTGCTIYPYASIGARTQDLKFKGGNPGVQIGNNTVIREFVSIHAATNDGDYTIIGDNCLLMAYCHVAHCCKLGNGIIMANAAQLSGHVVIEDMATIEGMVGVVQFVRIGKMCFIGAFSKVAKDVPPFMIGHGDPMEIRGVNRIGMERRGVNEKARRIMREAYRILYRQELSVSQALEKIEKELEPIPEIQHLVSFCRNSERGIVR